MNFNLSESQQLVRDSVYDYLNDNYDFNTHLKQLDGEGTAKSNQWQAMAELGWLSIGLTEDQGGLGGGALDSWALLESYGTSLCPEPVLSSAIICAPMLAESSATSASSVLEQLTSGQARVALAHTESTQYHVNDRIQTIAKKVGDNYQLTGKKIVVPDGGSAEFVIIPALLSEQNNELGLFLVSTSSTGLNKTVLPMADGSSAADFVLNELSLTADDVLFSGAEATQQLELALARAMAGQAAAAVGAMRAVLDITRQYLHDRAQFGRPLSSFQALQHRYADMVIAYERAYSMSILAANCVDSYASEASAQSDLHRAKVVIGQSAHFIGGQGIQLHGGMGMTQEYPVGHYYRKLLLTDTFYGSHQAHLRALSR